MRDDPIKKMRVEEMPVAPNLIDYQEAGRGFSWDTIEKELDWFENGGINIAYKFGYYERLSIGFTAPFHLW